MPIRDLDIAWKKKSEFFKVNTFMSMSNIALDGAAANAYVSSGSAATDGAPIQGDAGATATTIIGVDMGAAGDEVADFFMIPWDMDKEYAPEYRVVFVHQATDADTPIWKVHLLPRQKQEALAPPIDNASTYGETITFGAHTCSTTADTIEVTDWNTADASTITDDDIMLGLSLECDDLGSASADEINLLGLEMRYTVKATSEENVRETTDFGT